MTEICDWDDLVETNGLYYKKFTEVPFSGTVTGENQGSLKDGKTDGPWVWYHENGQLLSTGTDKNGIPDGLWVNYWENGQLMSKGTIKDAKKDGPWVKYEEDGTVDKENTGTYKDGVKISD